MIPTSVHCIFTVQVNDIREYGGKPSETDSIKFKISSKTPRGKKDSTKRHVVAK